jgi:phage replication-related protein YjqB (UPF0714/DUF867 family)
VQVIREIARHLSEICRELLFLARKKQQLHFHKLRVGKKPFGAQLITEGWIVLAMHGRRRPWGGQRRILVGFIKD